MKLLHTADLHIGRFLEGRARWDEQENVLNEIVQIADNEAVDIVLIAGDVYDSSIPPARAEAMFYRFIEALCKDGQRAVVIIAGNHDQPQRLSAAAELAAHRGIYLIGLPRQHFYPQEAWPGVYIEQEGEALQLRLPNGEHVVIAAVPYISESRMQEIFLTDIADDVSSQRNYEDCFSAYVQALRAAFRVDAANIVMAHLFLNGGVASDSERPLSMQVGGSLGVSASVLPEEADYIALGHLHRPQQIRRFNCRYAGSPLACSFSECGQTKSVVIAEIRTDCLTERTVLKTVALSAGRPLLQWTASSYEDALHWCANPENQACWSSLRIHLQQPLSSDEITELQKLHPHLLAIIPCYPQQHEDAQQAATQEDISSNILDRFASFAAQQEGFMPDTCLLRAFAELLEGGED